LNRETPDREKRELFDRIRPENSRRKSDPEKPELFNGIPRDPPEKFLLVTEKTARIFEPENPPSLPANGLGKIYPVGIF